MVVRIRAGALCAVSLLVAGPTFATSDNDQLCLANPENETTTSTLSESRVTSSEGLCMANEIADGGVSVVKDAPPPRVIIDRPLPPPFVDVIAYATTTEGSACANDDVLACARQASISGMTKLGLKHADHGCRLDDPSSCTWATKIAYELGEKKAASAYARVACHLKELNGCSWQINIERELGNVAKAFELATEHCNRKTNGAACGLAASMAHEKEDLVGVVNFGRKGCELNDIDSCVWLIRVDYEAGEKDRALTVAEPTCDQLKSGAACSYAGTILHEKGEKLRAVEFSSKGCALNYGTACEWSAQVLYELGEKQRAVDAGIRGCLSLSNANACVWAAALDYETNNKPRGLESAARGCTLGDTSACEWEQKYRGELNLQ